MTLSNTRRTVQLLAGLLALIVFAALATGPAGTALAGGGACHNAPTGAERDAGGSDVSMKGNCFIPTVLRVEPGTTVTFRNNDPNGVFHELAGVAMAFGSADIIRPDESATAVFEKAGVYPYACRLHFGMVGAIVVGDGKFEVAAAGVTNLRTSGTEASKAPAVQPAPSVSEVSAAAAADDPESKWLYAGGGLVAGTLLVAIAGSAVVARRSQK